MGMPLVALAKLKLTLVASHGPAPILAGGLIWPFLLKLSLSLRLLRRSAYADVVRASSLFLFQLRQIVADSEQRARNPGEESWMRRAVRLVCRSMASVRRSVAAQGGSDAGSLQTLSMITL